VAGLRAAFGVAWLAAVLTTGSLANELDRLVYGSIDAAASTFATVGAKVAQADGGPAMMISAGGGSRIESVPTVTGSRTAIRRTVVTTAAVFGYQWFTEMGALGAFAGPESSLTALTGEGGLAHLELRTGLRLQQEAWLRPSDDTLIQTTLIASTSRRSIWTRLAGGIRAFGGYIGPEAGFYGDATGYRKWTFGIHATDYELASRHLRLSVGGEVLPDARGIGPYVTLAVWETW
jgi:hypothetical protein